MALGLAGTLAASSSEIALLLVLGAKSLVEQVLRRQRGQTATHTQFDRQGRVSRCLHLFGSGCSLERGTRSSSARCVAGSWARNMKQAKIFHPRARFPTREIGAKLDYHERIAWPRIIKVDDPGMVSLEEELRGESPANTCHHPLPG